jgi:hypothetical protein
MIRLRLLKKEVWVHYLSFRLIENFMIIYISLESHAINQSEYLPETHGKGKAIPVTGRGGPYGCETSRLPHFLDNRLTDGGDALCAGRPLPPGRFLVLIFVRD